MIGSIKLSLKAKLRVLRRKKFPSVIQLQTTSACNSKCTCCPYHLLQKNQPIRFMSDELYQKIIDECAEHRIGKISLYLFNEPLMDKKIIDRLNYAKLKNPNARIQLSTNAGLLINERASQIANAVDYLYISVQGGITDKKKYEETMSLRHDITYKNIMRLVGVVGSGNFKLKLNNIAINNVIPFDNLTAMEKEKKFWSQLGIVRLNLGGFSTWANKINRRDDNYCKTIRGCSLKHRPLSHIHVVENGDVVLCCRDWERKYILGNIEQSSLFDIWNNMQYRDLVEKIYLGKNAHDNFICYRCEDAIRM